MASLGERSETGKVSTTQVVVMDEKDVALGRKRQFTTATRVIRANQRALVLNLLFVLLAIVVSTCATLAVVLTRPTHTGGDDLSGGTTLLAKNGEVVATATYEEEVSLAELPSQGASSDIYAQIKRVGWDTGAGAVMGFTVNGYVWYNNTDMDLFLDAGYTLHIADGDLHVSEGCCDLPDMSSGIAQRRRMNPVLWRIFIWAVRIYTVTHGSSHNGKDDDKMVGGLVGNDKMVKARTRTSRPVPFRRARTTGASMEIDEVQDAWDEDQCRPASEAVADAVLGGGRGPER